MLDELPELVVSIIGKKLGAKDLLSLSFTRKSLHEFFNHESYWQLLMEEQKWTQKRLFRYQDDALFLLNNTPDRLQKTVQFNQKVVRYALFSHDGTMLAAFGNGCRLWVFRGKDEILHVFLSRKRGWDRVISLEFSPDDNHLLVVGHKAEILGMGFGNEALVYKMNDDHATLRSFNFLGRRMFSTWFDNKNVIFTDDQGTRERMRLFISSVDDSADILVYPILTFNQRITKMAVAQHVSPRTRRITQIAEQAVQEGKSLRQKLLEVGVEWGLDTTNMDELRSLLDQESQCMPCYRLHSHHDAVSMRDCQCECHHNQDKLLVFHANTEHVFTKVVTSTMLERAREAFRNRGELEDAPEEVRLFFPLQHCNIFDATDHEFRTNLNLLNAAMCFSRDNRYLYITGTQRSSIPRDPHTLIKPVCIDLDVMLLCDNVKFSNVNWVEYDYPVSMSVNNDFLAIMTGMDVVIWSIFHRGNPVAIIPHNSAPVSSVTLHPLVNQLVVTNERDVHFYCSPILAREEKEKKEEESDKVEALCANLKSMSL